MDQDEFNVRARFNKDIEDSYHMPGKSWYRLSNGQEVITNGEGKIKGPRGGKSHRHKDSQAEDDYNTRFSI